MTDDRQQRIRQRAYELWEEEGYPHGQHERHWDQATRDVEAQGDGGQVTATEAELAASGSLGSEPVLHDGLVGDLSGLASNQNDEKPVKRAKRPAI